ncbi:MAG: 1-acyl-sn-glycerol-3-phosphate acyltransferase [Epsilonproteobacteria bacterium]|nr:1-acyl-sn-glycerol-3-phosphate acyltransferase [Campylobacterota bacterium]
MVLKCILGSIGHFIFFGLLIVFMLMGYLIYFIFKPFIKDSQHFFQEGSALSYRLFFLLTPRIVLEADILDNMPSGAIYVSTHQSILDFPAFAIYIKNYLIFANVNLGKFSIVEKITHSVGVRYIKGKSLSEVGDIQKELESHLDSGKNVIYFPEGTRHSGDKLLPFKRGAFKLAMKKNRPLVPVVIEGAYKFLPRKSWCFKTSKKEKIYLKMLPPLYPKDFKNEIEMMKYTQNIMQKKKDELCDLF